MEQLKRCLEKDKIGSIRHIILELKPRSRVLNINHEIVQVVEENMSEFLYNLEVGKNLPS